MTTNEFHKLDKNLQVYWVSSTTIVAGNIEFAKYYIVGQKNIDNETYAMINTKSKEQQTKNIIHRRVAVTGMLIAITKLRETKIEAILACERIISEHQDGHHLFLKEEHIKNVRFSYGESARERLEIQKIIRDSEWPYSEYISRKTLTFPVHSIKSVI